MKDDFSVLIQNRTEFEKGNPATVFLSLPATKEELHEAMKALNITADNPQDFFLNGYSTADNRRIEIPFDWIRDGDLDRINFLAARLEEMTPEQLEKLDAVMHSDFKPESLDRLIDHTYNTDFYSYVPGILSYKELGDYFLNDSGKVQMPEEWKAGIDKEDFGFNAALHEDGKLTDYGYIARSGTDWKEVYAGQETPEKYHIMGYPEAERPAPEQDEKETAPAVDIAAANPIRPIELKSQKSTEKIKEITDRLEQGIQDLFDSDRFKEYLRVMSKFHDYSFNNTLLIAMQKPDATFVAGYTSWKKDYGRQVVSHAKSIKVLAPSPYKVKREVDKIDPATNKPVIGKDGKPVKEETEVTVPAFKVVSVFDISQTEGKELPTIGVDELTGDVEQYADFFKATEQASPAPVGFEKIESDAKGYYSQTEKRIAINEGMSELQNLKTLIHEIAHAKLHDIDLNAPAKEQADRPDRRTREVQAESIAYAVCQHYGLDTSDYSFSVSDVVVLHQNGQDTAHYTDSIGFVDISKDFLLENPLKAAELSTEQNANMIDGVINNTPTADGLEANAGEQISLEQYAETLKQDEAAEPDTAHITAAAKSRYGGMVALFTMDDKIYIGKSENYDNKGHYDNKDNSLLYVSDCQAAFTFLSSEGCTYPQDEALNRGIYTKEDYGEFSRITDFLSQAGFTPEKEFFFADKPFSLQADTPEQTAPEAKSIYYTINESAARRANDMNSFSDYKPGSATAEYRQMVDKAVEIGERQKKRVDPMYHEKIDSLVDTYARKLAENMNSSFSIEARVPSILIAGGSNFPVRKKEKQNAARDRNMEDWNEVQGLLDKIRSTGMGGISADDPQAVQKLEAKLEKLQAAQDTMKAVNAYYRKHKTLDGCPNLSTERIEAMKEEMSSQWHIEDKPYPSWALSNNNAEIRRIKGRIADLTKKQETAYAGWEFDGGTVEANREDNRLQIYFEEKPDEKTRETLKESGFRWSPKAGAWQRQLNDNAIYAADRLSCIKPLSGKSPVEIQKEARTAAKTEKKPSIRAQLAQDKEALKNAPKKAAEKTKKQDLERS